MMERVVLKRMLVIAWVLLVGGGLQAGNPKLSRLTADDGLASSITYGSFEDRKGFIWFATEHGVSRYDGYTFTNFTTDDGLADNVIFDFFEDTEGRIWFYTFNGIPCYYLNGEITSFTSEASSQGKKQTGRICSIFEDRNGTVWISRPETYSTPAQKATVIDPYPLNAPFKSVRLISSIGQFWGLDSTCYLISGMDLLQYDRLSKEWVLDSIVSMYDFSAPVFSAPTVNGLVVGKGASIYRLQMTEDGMESTYLSNTPNGKEVTSIVRTGDDEFYIGTYAGGYSFKNDAWGACLLPEFGISSALKDREGNFWLTTLNNGVFYTSGMGIQHWDASDGLSGNSVTKILPYKDNQSLLLGLLDNTLAELKGGTPTSIPISMLDTLRTLGPVDIALAHDTIVVGFSRGITYYHPPSGFQEHLVMPSSLKSLYVSPEGELYACTAIGVFHMNQDNLEKIRKGQREHLNIGILSFDPAYFNQALPGQKVYAMTQLKNEGFLYGTVKGLVSGIEGDTTALFPDHPGLQFATHSITQSETGDIWVATHGGGVIRIQGDSIVQLTTRDGMQTNLCKSLRIDQNGWIWVGTNEGIIRIIPPLAGSSQYQIRNFSTKDGLSSNEINDLVISGDTLWLASPIGISAVPLSFLERSTPRPLIYLDSLSINKVLRDPGEELELHYDQNNVTIYFTGISFQSQSKLTYHFRLLGLSEEWNTTTFTEVEFLSLSPGVYTFEVYVTNFKGIRSIETLRLKLVIKSPWWAQWWAVSLGFALVVLFISLYFNRRLQILRVRNALEMDAARSEQKALRARIAPHFVYNALNSLQSLISDNRRVEALHYTARFSRLMRKVFEHSVENFIPLEEEIETLEMYLQLEQLRFTDKFTYLIELEEQLDSSDASIPSMILQPLLENSIWHGLLHQSKPGMIQLKIKQEDHLLHCLVEDNGVGREAAKAFRSKYATQKKDSGLEVTRERLMMLARLEGMSDRIKLEHTDLYDATGAASGTRVEVWLPLKSIVGE